MSLLQWCLWFIMKVGGCWRACWNLKAENCPPSECTLQGFVSALGKWSSNWPSRCTVAFIQWYAVFMWEVETKGKERHLTTHMSTASDKGRPRVTSGALYARAYMVIPTFTLLSGRPSTWGLILVIDKHYVVRFHVCVKDANSLQGFKLYE